MASCNYPRQQDDNKATSTRHHHDRGGKGLSGLKKRHCRSSALVLDRRRVFQVLLLCIRLTTLPMTIKAGGLTLFSRAVSGRVARVAG